MAIQFSKSKKVPHSWYNDVTVVDGQSSNVQVMAPAPPPDPTLSPQEINNPYVPGGMVVDSTSVPASMDLPSPDQVYQVVQTDAAQLPGGPLLWVKVGFYAWLVFNKELPFWARAVAGFLGGRLVLKNFKVQTPGATTVS